MDKGGKLVLRPPSYFYRPCCQTQPTAPSCSFARHQYGIGRILRSPLHDILEAAAVAALCALRSLPEPQCCHQSESRCQPTRHPTAWPQRPRELESSDRSGGAQLPSVNHMSLPKQPRSCGGDSLSGTEEQLSPAEEQRVTRIMGLGHRPQLRDHLRYLRFLL